MFNFPPSLMVESMRTHFWLAILVSLIVAGCGHNVIVFDPAIGSQHGDFATRPNGTVKGLREILSGEREVELVFIHGVADHCPGYALGVDKPQDGEVGIGQSWLNESVLASLGLRSISGTTKKLLISPSEVGAAATPGTMNNFVVVLKRDYVFTPSGKGKSITIHASEITWSFMTQWIKNELLGYDGTGVENFSWWNGVGQSVGKCVRPDGVLPKENFMAPPRYVVNAGLKWQIFDRALADALIYTGTYGAAMQRGIAAALCRVVNEHYQEGDFCAWPSESIAQRDFVFVTHSLGSRMLYDTIRSLTLETVDDAAQEGRSPFVTDYVDDAREPIKTMVRDTAAIYMMANQIPLLGLTNIPPEVGIESLQVARGQQESPQTTPLRDPVTYAKSTNSFLQAMDVRKSALDEKIKNPDKQPVLHVVSFNDTNDLLTWHLPPWYASDSKGLKVEPVVVFVRNDFSLFGVFENPLKAHTGYFENPTVWKVMFCGAAGESVSQC